MYRISLINNGVKRVIYHKYAEEDNRVIEARLDRRVSVFDTLTLSLLSEADLEITEMKTLIEIFDDVNNKQVFYGRVITREKDMDVQGNFLNIIEGESMLSLLNDSTQRPHNWVNTRLSNILNSMLYNHNNQKRNEYTFSCVIIDDVSLDFEVGYKNTYKAVQELIEAGNKEIYTVFNEDNKVITIYVQNQVGENISASIRLGENMQSINSKLDLSELATRVIPINPNGEEDSIINIKAVNSNKDYLVNTELEKVLGYSIERVVENTELETPAELKAWGQAQLTEKSKGDLQITAKYLDLSFIDEYSVPINLGDTVNVYNPALNIFYNVRALALDIDLFEPYNPTIELSTRRRGLTDNVLEIQGTNSKTKNISKVNTYTLIENITSANPFTDVITITNIGNVKDANVYITLDKYTIYNEDGIIQTTYPKDLNIVVNNKSVGTMVGDNTESAIFNIRQNLIEGNNELKITTAQNGRVKVKIALTTI